MMDRGQWVPQKELLLAVWAAVLTSATRILPGASAQAAGTAGWLAVLIALPGLLLMGWLLGKIIRPEEGGFAPAIQRLAGRWLSAVLYIIYIVWALIFVAARLRLSGRYFLSAVGQERGLWFFLPLMVAIAGWLARSKQETFLRTAALFARILTPALVALIILSLFQIRLENLWPIWTQDVLPALRAGMLGLGVLSCGVYGAFLPCRPAKAGRGKGTAAACGVLTLLQICILGNLGAPLAAGVEDPIITLSKNVGVEGAFQRVESLVSALWLLSDLALAGILLCACRNMLCHLFPKYSGRWSSEVCAAICLILVVTLFRDAVTARWFGAQLAPMVNIVLGLLVPGVLYLSNRKKMQGISCG